MPESRIGSYNESVQSAKIKTQLNKNGIKVGNLSKARWGEDSEEKRILKAFVELKNKAQIADEKKVIKEFEDLLREQPLACNMLGCYLSKYLDTPRLPLKVFQELTRSVFYKSGKFSKNEDATILKHATLQELKDGEYDLDFLKSKVLVIGYIQVRGPWRAL